ncbi:MAG: hypothetical protein L0Z62_32445 [Gemmataceae bacterium]|nr:hypothetical protein [Gemmataceae bacterium]
MSTDLFPRLTPTNHRVTSSTAEEYNCIAWATGDTRHWWQPGVYWPLPTPADDFGIAGLEGAFKALGYERCADGSLEAGFEKVVLYGDALFYTHAARQLPTARWTSKLGKAEDIEHDTPEDVAGGVYGAVVLFMRRAVREGGETGPPEA